MGTPATNKRDHTAYVVNVCVNHSHSAYLYINRVLFVWPADGGAGPVRV